jgi:hypothetical protein
MTTRTFYQLGTVYKSTPVQTTAWIDDEIVFTGTIDPQTAVLPPGTDSDYRVLFTWKKSLDADIPMDMKIEVTGGSLLLGPIWASLISADDPEYTGDYYRITVDGREFAEPRSDVKINGMPQERSYDTELQGPWSWRLYHGSEFQCTVHSGIPVTSPIRFQSPELTVTPESAVTYQLLIDDLSKLNNVTLPWTVNWKIEHITTVDEDFAAIQGSVTFETKESSIEIQIMDHVISQESKEFRICLESPKTGNMFVSTQPIVIKK